MVNYGSTWAVYEEMRHHLVIERRMKRNIFWVIMKGLGYFFDRCGINWFCDCAIVSDPLKICPQMMQNIYISLSAACTAETNRISEETMKTYIAFLIKHALTKKQIMRINVCTSAQFHS